MRPEAHAFLGGRLRLHQPPRGAHRAGTDAVLLAALHRPEPGAAVWDVGASTGAVGLACARLAPDCTVVLVERDPGLCELARANVATNDLTGRARVIEADVLAPGAAREAAGLTPGSADVLLTNPPYFETARVRAAHRPSPDPVRAAAHAFAAGSLDAWLRTCAGLLRPGGRLGLIHRADTLPACLDALARRFGDVAVRPVHPRPGDPAIRVLIAARRGSRAPLRLLPPLVLHDAGGRFTAEADALHRGQAAPR